MSGLEANYGKSYIQKDVAKHWTIHVLQTKNLGLISSPPMSEHKNLALRHPNAHPWGIVTQSAILPTVWKWVRGTRPLFEKDLSYSSVYMQWWWFACTWDMGSWWILSEDLEARFPQSNRTESKGIPFLLPPICDERTANLGHQNHAKWFYEKLIRFLKFGGVRFLW